jgi:hypothetical protein
MESLYILLLVGSGVSFERGEIVRGGKTSKQPLPLWKKKKERRCGETKKSVAWWGSAGQTKTASEDFHKAHCEFVEN